MTVIEITPPWGNIPYITFNDPSVCILSVGEANNNYKNMDEVVGKLENYRYHLAIFMVDLLAVIPDIKDEKIKEKILDMIEELDASIFMDE